MIDALRKYRPFTPTFVARAEDQAYIMSVLFEAYDGYLRYLHKDGLIMRHDKEAFAREAIEKAWAGKFAGDLARTLVFPIMQGRFHGEWRESKSKWTPLRVALFRGSPSL